MIFKDPSADADEPEAGWQTADEYLSGNVRNKLRMAQLAAESHPEFKINVEALTKAQPKDLEASEIDIRLGATWLNPAIVQQFMMETFQPPYRIRYNNLIQVRYSPFTSEWRIGNKSAAGMYDIMSTETYGTHRANAYKILEDTLNLRDCRIYQNQKYRLEDKLLKHYPEEIQKAKNRIAALKNDAQIADAHPQDKENFCGMTIKGMVFDEKKAAGERLMLACKEMPNADMMLLGTYRGFELNIRFDSFKNEHQIVLRGELSYPVPLGDDPRGNIVRLDNAIGNFADRIADADAALDSLEQQKQAAEVEIAKPFAQEEELQTKSARLAELDALLNMEHQSSRTEPEAEEKPDARPSVLAALEEKADKVEPVRPFKSYLDKDGDAR